VDAARREAPADCRRRRRFGAGALGGRGAARGEQCGGRPGAGPPQAAALRGRPGAGGGPARPHPPGRACTGWDRGGADAGRHVGGRWRLGAALGAGRSMSGRPWWLWILCLPLAAQAAPRARDGGALRIAVPPEVNADVAAETPEGASVRALTASPLCRVAPDGRVLPLLASVERRADAVAIVPRPGARFPSGAPLGAAELARAW